MCVCTCIHTYVHMYVCMYVHTYVCTYVCMYIRTYIHSPWRWRWDSAALETAACRGAARRRGAGRVRPLLSFRDFRNGASRAGWGNGRIPLVFHASLVSHGPLTRPA